MAAWLFMAMKDTIDTRLWMDTTQSKNRLLLIDGDPKSLRVLDVSLKKAGFDVTTATSGREALTLLEVSQPDLIISDTDLNEMDGFELCSQIKARPEWAKIPFIFVSGRKSIEDKIRGLELGVDDYLSKPIYIKEIGIRVRTALQRAERERMESRREGRTRFAGDLSDVGVVDLVQTIELNRKSGIIHIINRDGRHGSIFFRDGKVIDAEVGRLSGANAIYRLFSWSEGQFAVEFKQIRRHDVIDMPMAPLLMEGMRRLDESTRILDQLPPANSVLEVDCRALAEGLAELPDEANSVLRLCDGTRHLQEVIEDSDHPDLEALTLLNRLFTNQIIFARESPDPSGEFKPGARLAHWLSEVGAEDGAAAENATASSEFAVAQMLDHNDELIPEKTPVPTGMPTRVTRDRVAPALHKNVSDPEVEVRPLAEVRGKARSDASLAKTPGPYTDREDNVPKAAPLNTQPSPSAAILSAEESLGAVLAPQAEVTSGGNVEFELLSDTLKGIPVDNLFGGQEANKAVPPPPVANSASNPARNQVETRPTKPLGLAERLLSEDSAVRASAMHEAIAYADGQVDGPQSNERNTREYGNSAGEGAAALLQEVVSSTHETKREAPPVVQPERPTKEVDWGAWPTALAPSAKRLEEPAAETSTPAAAPVPVEPGSAAEPSLAKEAAAKSSQPVSTSVEQPTPKEVLPQEPPNPPAVPAPDPQLGEGAKNTQPEAAQPAAMLPTDGPGAAMLPTDGPGASDQIALEAPEATPVPSPSTPTPLEPQPAASRAARKTIPFRQLWLMACGAFVLGVVGYLGFGKKLPVPDESQPFVSSPVDSSRPLQTPPAPEPVKTADENKLPIAPAAAPKPDQAPAQPGHATTRAAAAALRAKCLEVDAKGKGKAKAVSVACRPALEAEPKDVELMVILARAEIDRGRLVEARSLAKKALATDPRRFDAHVFIGTAEQEAGRLDEARAAYKKYLELAPDGPYARELRSILNNL
jgi:CheY-like chemotaxis protein